MKILFYAVEDLSFLSSRLLRRQFGMARVNEIFLRAKKCLPEGIEGCETFLIRSSAPPPPSPLPNHPPSFLFLFFLYRFLAKILQARREMKKRNAADPGSAGRVLPRDQREKEDQRTSEPIERGMLASQHASRITNVSNILYTSANTYTGEMDAKYCHCRRELEPV